MTGGGRCRDRVAIVTGAAGGIGTAVAHRLMAEGAVVVLTDRRAEVEAVAASCDAVAVVGDASDPDTVRRVVERACAEHGAVDLLVNNAGLARPTGTRDPWERADADFDEIIGANLKTAFLFGRAVAPMMAERGGGDIVNVSTDHVTPPPTADRYHGHGMMDLYNAAKWGLNGLLLDWARSLRRAGVRVNNICPGAVDTPMLRDFLGRDPDEAELASWRSPDEVADLVVELVTATDGRTGDNVALWARS